jgi:hypothetical protein
MIQLTERQRRAIVALGVANLIALSAVGVLLIRARPTPEDVLTLPPVDSQQVDSCRQSASRALFDAGHSGLVHARKDGTILVQLQRIITSNDLRLSADAATWAALEAITSDDDCLGFGEVRVTVVFSFSVADPGFSLARCREPPQAGMHDPTACPELRATARADMADLLIWSMGEIDDAEFARRVDYEPPVTPPPGLP